MSKLVIIDGNGILHRAFHALPPLSNKDGQLTNAVYGFFSMLLKIIQDLQPACLVVCFDRPKPTFRQTLYVGYHAHRPKMDEGLVSQIGMVHEILEKSGIQIFEIDGYEADDLIGTLAFQSVQNSQGIEVIIVSGDRDMLQLVNSSVKVMAPITGMTNMLIFDEAKVEEKYGIKPSQIIDYKALVGDPSDGYPGVSGIGPKTAKDLLQKYKTLESLFQNLKELPQKIVEKLSVDAEQAALAKKLATIITDTPVNLDLKRCSLDNFGKEELKKEFEKLGFNSLIKRFSTVQQQETQEGKKKVVEKEDENEQLGLL